MAHFAKLDENNVVTQVIVVNNKEVMDPHTGREDEILGIAFCKKLLGGNWKQTSYNGNMRTRYAGVGYTYDASLDAFIPPKPYPSWTLDSSIKNWVAPLTQPTLTDEQTEARSYYDWDEDAYQADNTTGWVLRTRS